MKISEYLSETFHFLVVKFSIYLNRRAFVMLFHARLELFPMKSIIRDICTLVLNRYLYSKYRYLYYIYFFFFFFFFFFFDLGFIALSRIFHLYRADCSSQVGEKPENPEKNHLAIRKQNLAFPHVTRARLEPQR